MIHQYRLFIMAGMLLILGGCAGLAGKPAVEDTGAEATIQPDDMPVKSGNPAVIALLDRAQFENARGHSETAGTSLERALRIEPRNPWLWHELAQLRLIQGQYVRAISLARKSNSFAGGERRLQVMNWRLIGDARVSQGDPAGAEQAFGHAAAIEKTAD